VDIRTHHRQLQAAADAYSVARFVKSSAVGSLIFGGLALVVGLPGLLDSPINAGLVALGAMLLVGGIWGLSSPSPAGIVYQGVALIVIGARRLEAWLAAATCEPRPQPDAPPVQPAATPPPVPSRHPAGPSVRQEAARVPSWSRFPHPPARSGSAPLRRIVRRPCCGTSGVTPGNFTLR